MDGETDIYHEYPFRQTYLEASGWIDNDNIYYKIGIDKFGNIIYRDGFGQGNSKKWIELFRKKDFVALVFISLFSMGTIALFYQILKI